MYRVKVLCSIFSHLQKMLGNLNCEGCEGFYHIQAGSSGFFFYQFSQLPKIQGFLLVKKNFREDKLYATIVSL